MVTFVLCTRPGDAWRDEYKRDMSTSQQEIKGGDFIATNRCFDLGEPSLTSSSVQLLEADQGQQKGLQSLFADLLPTAPVDTPFVLHDVHTEPSVCGRDLKPDVVMGLRDKPCIPLTTAAFIDFRRQDGLSDDDESVGEAITYGRVFMQQLPRSLRSMVLVGLTDLCSITLILVTLTLTHEGVEELYFGRSAQLPDVRHTLLQLLGCEPQR